MRKTAAARHMNGVCTLHIFPTRKIFPGGIGLFINRRSPFDRVLHPLANPDRILKYIARFFEWPHGVVAIHRADFDLEMEIVPNLCANGPNDFEEKTCAVSKGTAVIVVAIVNARAQELRE